MEVNLGVCLVLGTLCRQFSCMEVNPSSMEVKYGVCLCMKLCGRQFWSTEANPGVCLVNGMIR